MPNAATSRKNGKKGGRPKGSTTRPQIRDYISQAEVKELVEKAKAQAPENSRLLQFLLEQIFGKAPQSLDVTSGGERITKVEVEIVNGHTQA